MTDNLMQKIESKEIEMPEKIYNNIFQMANDVGEDDIFIEPRCKMCTFEGRSDAEEFCEINNWNYSATARYLKDKGLTLSYKSVQKHIETHFKPNFKKIKIKNYANNLKSYIDVKNNSMQNLMVYRAILQKELLETISDSSGMTTFEHRKNIELCLKLIDQLMKCEEAEKSLHDDFKPIQLVAEKLKQIFQMEQENASPEVRIALVKIVDTLLKEIEQPK